MLLMPTPTPAVPPVTLADAKAHLRVTHDGEDALIADLIATAASFIGDDAGLALTTRAFRLTVSDCTDGVVSLPRHPVARIISVTVYDGDGLPSLIDGSRYRLDALRRPATLTLDRGVVPRDTNGIEIEFQAGFGDVGSDVPDALRRAVLSLVAHWYEMRGVYTPSDQPVSVPILYSRLVRPWRRIGV